MARRTVPAPKLSPYLTSVQAGSLQSGLSSPAVSHAKTITINPLSPSQQDLSLPEPQRPIQNKPVAAVKTWSGAMKCFTGFIDSSQVKPSSLTFLMCFFKTSVCYSTVELKNRVLGHSIVSMSMMCFSETQNWLNDLDYLEY